MRGALAVTPINKNQFAVTNMCDYDVFKDNTLKVLVTSAWSYCRQTGLKIPTIQEIQNEMEIVALEQVDFQCQYQEGMTDEQKQHLLDSLTKYSVNQIIECLDWHKITFMLEGQIINRPQLSLFKRRGGIMY
jgi:hypothetical protein